jgi:multiple sugar transport system permease protein
MADVAVGALPVRHAAGQRRVRMSLQAAAYALSAPALVCMFLFLLVPLAVVLLLSFTDYQLGALGLRIIGLGNYAEMARDATFQKSLRNTLIYVAIVVPGTVGLGLGAALLIEADRSLRGFYRAAYFLPVMATLIAMAIVWEFMLHPQLGLINHLLRAMGFPGRDWLHDQSIVLFTLCAIGVWQSLGFNMILFMAGLTAIPKDLYEAAAVDGVHSGWERFRTVTWPLLGPVTLFTLIISAIRAFQVFDTVAVLTMGGPNKASEVLLYTMYTEGFSFFRTGYAAAVAIVFLVFVLVLSVIKLFLLDRRVHY